MEKTVPKGWSVKDLGDIAKFSGGSAFKEIYQGLSSGTHPFIKVSDMNLIGNERYIKKSNNWISEEIKNQENIRLFPPNSVIFAKVGAALLLNRRRLLVRETAIDNNMMAAIPYNCEPEFLFYLMQTIDLGKIVLDGAVPSVNQDQMKTITVNIPPLPEQKKIISTLKSIDITIEKIHSKIRKLKDLKISVMNNLMTKGLNHKEFKNTKLGKIPKKWNVYKYKDLLKIVDNKVEMEDDKFYQLISIKRRNGGVFSREKLIGKKILTKSLGKVIVNSFIISKMQIVHGASGYVSEKFKDYYASSSYTQFIAKDEKKLSTKFLFYYSHLDNAYKQFLVSSQGVHIEKMTFILNDWLKKEIALPDLEEQKKIVKIIESLETHISNTKIKLEKYIFLKRSINQDLITGKVRFG